MIIFFNIHTAFRTFTRFIAPLHLDAWDSYILPVAFYVSALQAFVLLYPVQIQKQKDAQSSHHYDFKGFIFFIFILGKS